MLSAINFAIITHMLKSILITRVDFRFIDALIPVLAFTIPFFVPGPQWFTGTLVNCFLFLYVSKFSKKNIAPVIILPSIGALLNGLIFGPLTVFLVYFIPFIWMGNFLLLLVFSNMKNYNYLLRIVVSSFAKFGLLFLVANIYFGFHVVPKLFINSMGLIQLVTALAGGALSYLFLMLGRKRYE